MVTPRPSGYWRTVGEIGTLGLATALYIGVAFVVVGMVTYTDIDAGAPIADAFDQVGLFSVLAMLLFLVVVSVPFVYEWSRGGLEWD